MLIKPQPRPIISIEDASGPRKDVFSSIDQYIIKPPTPDPEIDPLIAGKVRIHSTSTPHIQGGETYTIDVNQKIQWQQQTQNLHSTKQFKVIESPLTLDASAIHSVYPPPGHSDFTNVLPHVIFNNPSFPWTLSPGQDAVDTPWVGLITFTEDELTACDEYFTSNQRSYPITPTFAKSMTVSELNNAIFLGLVSSSFSFDDANNSNQTMIQAVMVPAEFFRPIFLVPHSGAISLDRFKSMCHVRSVETAGMTNRDGNGQEQFSTVIGVRTGPLEVTTPTVVHTHLVSLYGLVENVNYDPKNSDPVAMISLYSWSHTCLPTAGESLHALLRGIGSNVQPFRAPDILLNQATTGIPDSDDWVKNRMLGGYSLLDYRTSSGAQTIAFHRGPLTPFRPAVVDFPPSDYGTELAFADTFTGVLDVTFQLAWELGRLLMANDRSTSAALMRLRRDCHCDAMMQAKNAAVQNAQMHASPTEIIYIAQNDALNAIPSSITSLTGLTPANGTAFVDRWNKPTVFSGARSTFAFQTSVIQAPYRQNLLNSQAQYSRALPSDVKAVRDSAPMSDCFNELNCPMSSDYAKVLSWCMDAWFLQGIPMHYVLPDPVFVPRESIRTFYVDSNWFKVFFDGAFSVTEHYTDNDEVRESIKANLDDYLASPLTKDIPKPLVPRWGFILRSEIVSKFPDLRISAPRTLEVNEDTEHDGRPEVIRKETVDTDTLIALFDREPTRDQFPDGITLHGPEHQLCNMLGEPGDLTKTQLTLRWKSITTIDAANNRQSEVSPTMESSVFYPNDDPANDVFEFNIRAVRPQAIADAVVNGHLIDRSKWQVTADSWEPQALPSPHPPSNVLDGDIHTLWHTKWIDGIAQLPHWIQVDLQQSTAVNGLIYTPRQAPDSFNGTIGTYQIFVSDYQNWDTISPVAQGTFPLTRDATTVNFPTTRGRYVRLKALSEAQNSSNQWSSCSELNLLGPAILPGVQSTPSLLGAQLISTVPKLKLTCPANLQAAPAPQNSFSTSKSRPNSTPITTVPPPSIQVPRSVASEPSGPAPLPSADATPHLAALARVDLYLDVSTDSALFRNYFENRLHSPVWQEGPGNPGIQQAWQPQSIINIYNLRGVQRNTDNPTAQQLRGLFTVLPVSYGFRTDIHASVNFIDANWSAALNPGLGTKLRSLKINFSVGEEIHTWSTSPSSLIVPFASDQPIPTVRTTGMGRRWIATTSITTEGDKTFFTVTITPNKGDPTDADYLRGGYFWEVETYGDLGFVIENVQLNGPSDATYPQSLPTMVTTVEEYVVASSNTLATTQNIINLELDPMDAHLDP